MVNAASKKNSSKNSAITKPFKLTDRFCNDRKHKGNINPVNSINTKDMPSIQNSTGQITSRPSIKYATMPTDWYPTWI